MRYSNCCISARLDGTHLKTEQIGTAHPSIAHSDFSTVATSQNHYIKTASPDAMAAMKQFSEALLCSTFAPDRASRLRVLFSGVVKCLPMSKLAEREGFYSRRLMQVLAVW